MQCNGRRQIQNVGTIRGICLLCVLDQFRNETYILFAIYHIFMFTIHHIHIA